VGGDLLGDIIVTKSILQDTIGRMNSITDLDYAFTGCCDGKQVSNEVIVSSFHGEDILREKDRFLNSIRMTYELEKKQSPLTREIDLEKAEDIERAYFHTKVHAITGLLEWGTSNTYSIPYWDIQALSFALINSVGGEQAEVRLQRNYIESIRALLGYLAVAGDLYRTAKSSVQNLATFTSLGQVTRTDLSAEILLISDEWFEISERLHIIILAKYKHVLFLTDQITSKTLRSEIFSLIRKSFLHLHIDPALIVIDIGIDCGLIAESHRPPYVISVYRQLDYLNKHTYDVSRIDCPIFTYNELIKSICRLDTSKSVLIDPVVDILLPWRSARTKHAG
jgi:hypothetical protein